MSKKAIPITLVLLGSATVAMGIALARIENGTNPGYPWYIF